jgi:hypothetical protein
MNRCTLSIKLGSFLMVLFFLVGCATKFIELDKPALNNIKKIALLRVNEPKKIQFLSYRGFSPFAFTSSGAGFVAAGPVGATGGSLVGSLLDYYTIGKPTQKKRSKAFLKAKNEAHKLFSPAMAAALREELTNKGYEVIYIEDQSLPSTDFHQTDYYSQLQTNADAILSIVLWSVGYTEREDSWFTPDITAYTELFNTSSKKIIYSRMFYIGPANVINAETMFPDEKYKYNSFDTLMKNFDEAAQGIIDCHNKIAVRIAEHLK